MNHTQCKRTEPAPQPSTNRKDCQLCARKNLSLYYDAKIIGGVWADMCSTCFQTFGIGLGVGRGQQYIIDPVTDRYQKVDG